MTRSLKCGSYRLSLHRPLVMAIINATPDSFSGDGVADDLSLALRRADLAIAAGADILDIGGESTRPGSLPVSEADELKRVLPLVERLARLGIPVSVDTTKPVVMAAVLAAGASMINDVNALQAPDAIRVVAASDCALCVMHAQGEPRTMQERPSYTDVRKEVSGFLSARFDALRQAGVETDRITIDPGFGFGKSLSHNVELFGDLNRLAELAPVLVGVSRKRMLGDLTGLPVESRATPSAMAAVAAAARGASILRVHDVADTVAALRIWAALGPSGDGARAIEARPL